MSTACCVLPVSTAEHGAGPESLWGLPEKTGDAGESAGIILQQHVQVSISLRESERA